MWFYEQTFARICSEYVTVINFFDEAIFGHDMRVGQYQLENLNGTFRFRFSNFLFSLKKCSIYCYRLLIYWSVIHWNSVIYIPDFAFYLVLHFYNAISQIILGISCLTIWWELSELIGVKASVLNFHQSCQLQYLRQCINIITWGWCHSSLASTINSDHETQITFSFALSFFHYMIWLWLWVGYSD